MNSVRTVPVTTAGVIPAPERELYIDRLRTIMTAQVVVFHAAITYGSIGGWFYHEVDPSGSASSFLLTAFCVTSQAYFMGLFFLLAGYFTPGSLDRKGPGKFIADRALRLGLPLLAFGLVLGPLTLSMVGAAEGRGFLPTWSALLRDRDFVNGPLWFTQALLIFSLAYCGWRALTRSAIGPRATPRPTPGHLWWLASAVGVGAVALAIRQIVPAGVNVLGLQLGYFSSYIFLFALGIAARRHDWMRHLTWRQARLWIIILILVWPTLPGALVVMTKLNRAGETNFSGGLSWAAILYAFWEPFVAWGLIAAWIMVARTWMNRPSSWWEWLNRRAYAVYIIHPVVLVGISLLLRHWMTPPLLKWSVAGLLACIVCWLTADPLVRLPGVRRII